MLYDKEFLLKLDKCRDKTIYARITALKFDESPVEYIEGRITGGSINLDGASALRRTCSLTMVAQLGDEYHDYYWGLNSKFKLEVGVQNFIDSNMPDIIWFNQGIYLISNFNTSHSTSNYTISISGKDKMCLLNGEVGGSLESSVDFGTIEEEDKNGVWTIRKLPIQEIIRNAVHTYAGEPYWNIIINDLDTYALELLEYRYDTPMYIYRKPDENLFYNVIIENPNTKVSLTENGELITLDQIPPNYLDTLVDSLIGAEEEPEHVWVGNQEFIFAKIEYGHTVGYRVTDLVYPGDLIAGIGESITSVLDKIKNMLTEFEYFYDVDGSFIFQKKKSFTSTLWTPLSEEEEYYSPYTESAELAYTFSGGELITAFNNNPNLLNMRNDYSIWGERKGSSGAAIPIHMRYAIDKKPLRYRQLYLSENDSDWNENKYTIDEYNTRYGTTLKPRMKGEEKVYSTEQGDDWREIIYQMALDYYKYNILDNFELLLIRCNLFENEEHEMASEYPSGQTGYEKYYIDIQGFWRQLFNPEIDDKIAKLQEEKIPNVEANIDVITKLIINLEKQIKATTNEISVAPEGTNTTKLEKELIAYQNDLNTQKKLLRSAEIELEEYQTQLKNYKEDKLNYYYPDEEDVDEDYLYWNRNVFEHPELLNFWFDFLDTEGELQDFNVKNVGSRSKSINDTNVKSIYFRETPSVVFTDDLNSTRQLTGYRYIQVPMNLMDSMFSISAQGKSAKDRLDELIYQHGYCIESVSITAIPVYYLEPNVRVYVYDEKSNIDGEYVVSKITLPLTYNGTMSITATKAAESLY